LAQLSVWPEITVTPAQAPEKISLGQSILRTLAIARDHMDYAVNLNQLEISILETQTLREAAATEGSLAFPTASLVIVFDLATVPRKELTLSLFRESR
jgi:hypothetical protein